jgi:OOP family OmpA-OmpF porin
VIKPEFFAEVKKVADFMKEYDGTKVVIEGHTDSVGDRTMNQELSERRAATVAGFLIEQFRLPAERLSTRGVGEGQLMIPTADNVPEPRNRRVHIVNLDG